jgi:hypothetical protein
MLALAGYIFQSCELLDTQLQKSERPCTGSVQLQSEVENSPELQEELLRTFMPILQVHDPDYFVSENFGVLAQAIPLVEGVSCLELSPDEYEEGDWALSYAFVHKRDEGIPELRIILAEHLSITVPDELVAVASAIDSRVENAHPGDIEHVRIIVNVNPQTGEATIKYIEVKVHYNGFIRYEPQYVTCSADGTNPEPGPRVEIIVGIDKHANHITRQTCQLSYGLAPFPEILGYVPVAFSGDQCDVHGTVDPLTLYSSENNIANGNPFDDSPLLSSFRGNTIDSSIFEGDLSPEFNFCRDNTTR